MTQAGRTTSNEDLIDAVNRVFALFEATWPRKFASIWKTDGEGAAESVRMSKRSWMLAFRDYGLTPQRLAAGLAAVRLKQWPPDNPGEFLMLCKVPPSSVGAPDLDSAFKEAVRGSYPYARHRWSHKCVYWAAVWTGLTDLCERSSSREIEKEFAYQYQLAIEQAEKLDKPPAFRIENKAKPTKKEIEENNRLGREACAHMREMLSKSSKGDDVDLNTAP